MFGDIHDLKLQVIKQLEIQMLHFNNAEQPLNITRNATFQTGIKTYGKIQNAEHNMLEHN